MHRVNDITAITSTPAPAPKETMQSAVTKQNVSRKTLPQVR